MQNPRPRKHKPETAPIPSGRVLRKLDALCALGKAHARAKAAGVAGTRNGARKKHARMPSHDAAVEEWQKRVNFLIELETRWRLRQLGVPYTKDMLTRFPEFDMASKHRMEIEAEHTRENYERMKAKWAKAREAKNELPSPPTGERRHV